MAHLNAHRAAVTGLLFILPFFILNVIVALRFDPFYSLLGAVPAIRNSTLLPLILLLLLPIGAYVAARPMLQKDESGKRKMLILNSIVAVTLIALFIPVFFGLGQDMYRCDILHIPNCD
jgi:ethanolamine transporter EutH